MTARVLPSEVPMNLRRLALAALPSALLFVAACGDGDDIGTIDNARTSTPLSGDARFGTGPRLGGNILEISPTHAQAVKQATTRSPNPQDPKGVCATVSFNGLPETGQWFRMAVDGIEVTDKLTWIVASREAPTGGKVCFAPAEGLTVGDHAIALSVQDPNNPNADERQLAAWKFAVTE